jgi:hypothetical protein
MQPTVLILRKEHPLGLGFAGNLQVQATRQSNPRSIQYGTSKKRYSCMHITEEPKQRAARWLSPVPLCRVLPLIAHLLLPLWSLIITVTVQQFCLRTLRRDGAPAMRRRSQRQPATATETPSFSPVTPWTDGHRQLIGETVCREIGCSKGSKIRLICLCENEKERIGFTLFWTVDNLR